MGVMKVQHLKKAPRQWGIKNTSNKNKQHTVSENEGAGGWLGGGGGGGRGANEGGGGGQTTPWHTQDERKE